jgi:carboxylesterase type B
MLSPFPQHEFTQSPFMFKPVVDGYASKQFLPKEPLELIAKGEFNQVPMIVGGNRDEGLLLASNLKLNTSEAAVMLANWETYIPVSLLSRDLDELDTSTAKFARTIKQEFFGGREPNVDDEADFKVLVQIFGDTFANYVNTKTARMLAAKNKHPVYEYRYTHEGSMSLGDFIFGGITKFVVRVS